MLKQKIGPKAMVGHGSDGPPGVLLAPGKSIKIEVSGGKSNVVRVIAMTAPTKVPDSYVSGLISLAWIAAQPPLIDMILGMMRARKPRSWLALVLCWLR